MRMMTAGTVPATNPMTPAVIASRSPIRSIRLSMVRRRASMFANDLSLSLSRCRTIFWYSLQPLSAIVNSLHLQCPCLVVLPGRMTCFPKHQKCAMYLARSPAKNMRQFTHSRGLLVDAIQHGVPPPQFSVLVFMVLHSFKMIRDNRTKSCTRSDTSQGCLLVRCMTIGQLQPASETD
jgi:hypothetical protein